VTSASAAWLVLVVALVAANLPWITERFFFVLTPPGGSKRVWMRLLEWLVLLGLVGLLAAGLERRLTGRVHPQDWEFYTIGVCLFLVFALPGFIYRHELKRHLDRRR
jgi:uncharacterized membrane protein